MFLEPIFLGGLAAIGLPIIIHLMHSPRATIVDFPTIRFLLACQKKAVRRSRLKNLILLLFRVAIVALVALGMARPWKENQETSVKPNTPITMVIVLDNSYSMGYREQGRSRFEQAQEEAIRLVDALKPGDRVAVILMNEQAEPYLRKFTSDHEHVKRALRDARLSPLGTNVDAGFREALKFARAAGADDESMKSTIEIVMLTDMQAVGWEALLYSGYLRLFGENLKVYLAGFGRENSPNNFIETVRVASSGSGESTVMLTVSSDGIGQADNIASLDVDGTNVNQEAFAVDPMRPVFVALVARFPDAGSYRCVLTLQEDNLSVDDRHYFTVNVGDRSSVLVVDGDPMSIPSLSDAYYVSAALNPGIYTQSEGSAIDAQVIPWSQFPSASLAEHRCIVLCNVPHFDGTNLIRLENFLREGGGVMIFLGDKVDAARYNEWEFLPIGLTEPEGDRAREESTTLRETPRNHPIFRERLDLRSARFFVSYGTDDTKLKEKAKVLARFGNGSPAVIEGEFGKGKVLVFTSTADLDWNNFPLRRSFLPWLYRSVYYVANQNAHAASFMLNDRVMFQGLSSAYKTTITVTDPSGRASMLRPEVREGYAEAAFSETREPGMYEVEAEPAFTNSGGFGVNVDRKESSLAMVDPEQVVLAGSEGLITYFDGTKGDLAQAIQRAREGKELWPLLFKIACLLFVLEAILANAMSRVKRSRTKVPLFDLLRRRSPGIDGAISKAS